jgi:hypothetical protein
MMKKESSILLSVILLSMAQLLPAGAQDERRIEEEKRESLNRTEEKATHEKEEPSLREQIKNAYFEELLIKKAALNKDACKIIIILLGVEGIYTGIESQIDFLEEAGIISPKEMAAFNPEKPLSKGTAACMFCRALKIRGGLWLMLFGATERYALRELVYEDIMLQGNVDEIISGKELILILTKAAEYAAENKLKLNPNTQ